jgi:hypothetical protein
MNFSMSDSACLQHLNRLGGMSVKHWPPRESELRATYNRAGIGANSVGSSPLTF